MIRISFLFSVLAFFLASLMSSQALGQCSVSPVGIVAKSTVSPYPTITQTCNGSTFNIEITGGQFEVWYKLELNGVRKGSAADLQWKSTSTKLTFLNLTEVGNYIVSGVWDSQYGCTTSYTTVASLNISNKQTFTTISIIPSTSPSTLCDGSAFYLTAQLNGTAPAGAIYKWKRYDPAYNGGAETTVQQTTSAVYTPPVGEQSGRYIVSIVNPCGGADIQSEYTYVSIIPRVGVPSTPYATVNQLCKGSAPTAYTSTATNATSYSWTVTGTGNKISDTGVVTWDSGFIGQADIRVTAYGCGGSSQQSAAFPVYVNQIDVGSVGGTAQVCTGISTSISLYRATNLNPNVQYYLVRDNGTPTNPKYGSDAAGNPVSSIQWSTSQPGTYSVVASGLGCTNAPMSGTASISNIPTPTVSISSNSDPGQVCDYTAFRLTATSNVAVTYSWYRQTNALSTTPHSNPYPPTEEGSYYAKGTNSCGVTSAASNYISVDFLEVTTPVVTATNGITNICKGTASASFQANAQNTVGTNPYVWSLNPPSSGTISSTGVVIWSSSVSGQVQVRATASGCNGSVASGFLPVNFITLPDATTIPAGSLSTCNQCNQTLTGPTGSGYSYQWIKDGSDISGARAISYDATQTGKYSVRVTQGTCSNTSAQFDLHLNTLPVVNAGVNQTLIAPVTSLTFAGSASDSDGTISRYLWTQLSGDNTVMTNKSTSTLTASELHIGNYVFQLEAIDDKNEKGIAQVAVTVNSPPNNYNYVRQETVRVKGKTNTSDLAALPADQKSETWSYMDGLGRTVQKIGTQLSPQYKDMIQTIVYDSLGREAVSYLPYTKGNDGSFKTSALTDQAGFYQNAPLIEHDLPYSKTLFEPSPMNRILKQGASGSAWQPNSDLYDHNDKSIKKAYELNTGDDKVCRFNYDFTTGLLGIDETKFYDPNTLYVNKTFDEKNNIVIEYTDKEGRTVCKKVQSSGTENAPVFASTYYIYDDFGNLVVVLPPEAVKKIKSVYNLD